MPEHISPIDPCATDKLVCQCFSPVGQIPPGTCPCPQPFWVGPASHNKAIWPSRTASLGRAASLSVAVRLSGAEA